MVQDEFGDGVEVFVGEVAIFCGEEFFLGRRIVVLFDFCCCDYGVTGDDAFRVKDAFCVRDEACVCVKDDCQFFDVAQNSSLKVIVAAVQGECSRE